MSNKAIEFPGASFDDWKARGDDDLPSITNCYDCGRGKHSQPTVYDCQCECHLKPWPS